MNNNGIKNFVLLFITLAQFSCSHPKDFKFNLPDISPWTDIEIKFLTASDGIKLAYRELGNIQSQKGMIIVPGSTMYGYYYIPFMKSMLDEDLYIRVIDLRGHGDSGGDRGDVPDENSLVEDLNAHVSHINSMNPNMKIVICGHSMGAGVCGRYLETYGYDSVDGAVYLAPFFHYRQPGMKDADYVDVNIFMTIFGSDHEITQVYHPTGDDPKLVRKYTKIMSKASMVKDFFSFKENHTTKSIFVIGKQDELFDWVESQRIFSDSKNISYIILSDATHLDVDVKGSEEVVNWLKRF